MLNAKPVAVDRLFMWSCWNLLAAVAIDADICHPMQSLLELVANEMSIDAVEADGALCKYYANTLAYIRSRGTAGGAEDSSEGIAKQYADLQL